MRQIMLRPMLSCSLAGFLVVLCCFLCHCGVRYTGEVPPDAGPPSPAEKLLQTILTPNAGVDAIKGLGRVNLWQDGQFNSFRAYWIGRQPDQFRLEVVADTGQPIFSFACDGRRFYFLSYSDNRLYRRKTSDNGLRRIISIDMAVADLLDLMSGRIPIQQGGDASLEENGTEGPLLIVEDRARKCIETAFLDASRTTVREFERRERNGKLLFRAVFEETGKTEGFQLPVSMTICNDDGAEIKITVERCWVNPELTEDQFILEAS
jgi:hypothetical protein